MEAIALGTMLKKILDAHRRVIDENGIHVSLHLDQPLVWSNAALLEQVFSSIIDRAVRCRENGSVPRIVITSLTTEDEIVVTVECHGGTFLETSAEWTDSILLAEVGGQVRLSPSSPGAVSVALPR
jgi:C4-dicarboxylate-specific signal transduction histidine kinase